MACSKSIAGSGEASPSSPVLRVEIVADRLLDLLCENKLRAVDMRCLDAESKRNLHQILLHVCARTCGGEMERRGRLAGD